MDWGQPRQGLQRRPGAILPCAKTVRTRVPRFAWWEEELLEQRRFILLLARGSLQRPAWKPLIPGQPGCPSLGLPGPSHVPEPLWLSGASPGALLLPPAQAAWHSQALHTKLPLDSLSWANIILPVKLFISKICHQSLMGQI